jgi:hypothetical protein
LIEEDVDDVDVAVVPSDDSWYIVGLDESIVFIGEDGEFTILTRCLHNLN